MWIDCPGVVVTDVAGVPSCQDMEGAPLAWQTVRAFDVAELDPSMLASAWGAGVAVVLMGWAIGFGFRQVLSMLKS